MNARQPGRPRSERARLAVLLSATSLIEEDGYGALTVEAIARRAGVSRQTVYRWWSSKAEIVLEALNEAAALIAPPPARDSLEADLRLLMRQTIAGASHNREILAALMAEAQLDQRFAQSFRDGFLARRRLVLEQTLERAQARGEISDAANFPLLADVAFGTLWYRIMAAHAPLDQRFADHLTEGLLQMAAPGSET